MRASVFWVVMPPMLVVVYRRFGQAIDPTSKGQNVQEECREQVEEWLYRSGVGSDWFSWRVSEPDRMEHWELEERKEGHQRNIGKTKRRAGRERRQEQSKEESQPSGQWRIVCRRMTLPLGRWEKERRRRKRDAKVTSEH
jgi:hypothetical protein